MNGKGKSKVLMQFLLIFRQFGDVLSFLYARRLRGYTATVAERKVGAKSKEIENLPTSSHKRKSY